MGVSDGFQGGGSGCELDCSVGTIVWVRRRNGSWWPGRILGPEELSASHLMSPRSGTPVKLLGREDASVDWYNLEKSKRVKAFRCGEFDDCIDKAEKSQGAAIKKREKYARREDAILHALELERLQLEKKLGIANGSSSKLPPQLKKELVAPTERVGYDHGKLVNLKAQSLSKGLGSSLEEESTENHLYAQKEKLVKLPIGVKDNSEALPRMRGLQDFGLRTSSTKRKLSASEGSCKAFSDDIHVPGLPSGSRSMDGANHVNSSRNSLSVKRKTQGTENSLVKRRDRRRPLVQILQSSAKMPVSHALQSDGDVSLSVQGEKEQMGVICRAKRSRCIYQPAESNELLNHTDLSSDEMQRLPSQFGMDNGRRTPGSSTEENTSSGVMDEAESDSSERDYLNPEMDEEMAVLQDLTHTMTGAEPRISKRYMANFHVQGQTESMSSEDLDESAVNGYMPHLHPHDQIAAGATDVGVSKWQLKGKRNTRNLMKRPMEIGPKGSNGSIYAAYLEGKRNSLKKRSLGQTLYHGHDALNYDYDEDELIEKKPTQTQLSGFGNRRYPSMLKDFGASNTDTVESEDDTVWEAEGPSQTPFRGYWDESAELDPVYTGQRLGNGKKSMLVDVDLQVRSSYQGERVPLVSLMSRLNGKAIVGHPVQIEALEDGSTAAFFSSLDDSSGERVGNDGSTSLKPVWRTARRTAMHRIPRPHPSTELNEEGGGPSQYSDLEVKPLYKKPHSENPYQKARKSFRYPEKRSSKKPIKKVSLLNQKTRTLSSIAIDHKVSGKACNPKHENKSGSLDGLIKPENGPLACIPVKIVFSRLMEAVGKPPSRLPNHSTVNGDTEKKPS